MSTIYFDHAVFADEQNWQTIRSVLSGPPARTLVASHWNLVEIAQGSDRQQAMRRIDFVSSLVPHWIICRLHLQRVELQNFLLSGYWNESPTQVPSITSSFTTMLSYNMGTQTPVDWTPQHYVANLFDNRGFIRDIKFAKGPGVEALKTLQDAGRKGRKSVEEKVLHHWVLQKMPDASPDGRLLKTGEKEAIAAFCVANSDALLRSSPALAVESALSEVRARDAKRKPESQDTIDLQHAVVALSYCDSFVVHDGYLRVCAEETAKLLAPMKLADIGKLSDFAGSIAA